MSCLWKLIMEDNQNRVKMNKEKTLHNYTDTKVKQRKFILVREIETNQIANNSNQCYKNATI
jgi:hypothetical protein